MRKIDDTFIRKWEPAYFAEVDPEDRTKYPHLIPSYQPPLLARPTWLVFARITARRDA